MVLLFRATPCSFSATPLPISATLSLFPTTLLFPAMLPLFRATLCSFSATLRPIYATLSLFPATLLFPAMLPLFRATLCPFSATLPKLHPNLPTKKLLNTKVLSSYLPLFISSYRMFFCLGIELCCIVGPRYVVVGCILLRGRSGMVLLF